MSLDVVSDDSSFGGWDSLSSNDGESASDMRPVPAGREHVKTRTPRADAFPAGGVPPTIRFAGSIERLERLNGRQHKVWRERYGEVTNDEVIIYSSLSKAHVVGRYSLHGAQLVKAPTEQRFSFTRLARPNGVVKEGYLFKSSGKKGFKKWDKRWFVLSEDRLVYRDSPDDSSIKGDIRLTNTQLVALSDSDMLSGKIGFEVVTPDRTFVLYAEKEAANYEWLAAIQAEVFQCTGREAEEDDKPPATYLQLFYGEGLKKRVDLRITPDIATLHTTEPLGPSVIEARITKLKGNNKEAARLMKVYNKSIHICDPANPDEVKYRIPMVNVLMAGPASAAARGHTPHAIEISTTKRNMTFFADTAPQTEALSTSLNTTSNVARNGPKTAGVDEDILTEQWREAIQGVLTADLVRALAWNPAGLSSIQRFRSRIIRAEWVYERVVTQGQNIYQHSFAVLTDFALVIYRTQPTTEQELIDIPHRTCSILGAESRLLTPEEAQGKRNPFILFSGNRAPIPMSAWSLDSMVAWVEALDSASRRFTNATVATGCTFQVKCSARASELVQLTIKREGVEMRNGDTPIFDYAYREIKSYVIDQANNLVMSVDGRSETIEIDGNRAYLLKAIIDCVIDEIVAANRRVEGLVAMGDELGGESDESDMGEWKGSDDENNSDEEKKAAAKPKSAAPASLLTPNRRGSAVAAASAPCVIATSLERQERRGDTKIYRERYAEVTNENVLVVYKNAAKGRIIGYYPLHGGVTVCAATPARFTFANTRDTSRTLKEGYLTKSSGKKGFKKFDRRWFKLTTDMLVYAQDKDDPNIKGEVALNEVMRVNPSNSNKLEGVNGFEVVTSERTYILYGDDDRETADWAKAVRDAAELMAARGRTGTGGESPAGKRSSMGPSDTPPANKRASVMQSESTGSKRGSYNEAAKGAERVIKEGLLTKSSGKKDFKKWDKRYFTLTDTMLTYKEKATDKKDKGEIKIMDILSVGISKSANLEGVVGIDVRQADRTYVLYDDDVSVTYAWCEAIQEAVKVMTGRAPADDERPPQLCIQLFHGAQLRKRLDVRMADRGTAARLLNALAGIFQADHETVMGLNPAGCVSSTDSAVPQRIVHAGWLYGAVANEKRRTRNILKWGFYFVILTDTSLVLLRDRPQTQAQFDTLPRKVFSLLGSESRTLTDREDRGRPNSFVVLTGSRLPIAFCAWESRGRQEWIDKIDDTAKSYTKEALTAGVTLPVMVAGQPASATGFTMTITHNGVTLRGEEQLWQHAHKDLKNKVENEILNVTLPDGNKEKISGAVGEIGQATLLMQLVCSATGESTTNKRISQMGQTSS